MSQKWIHTDDGNGDDDSDDDSGNGDDGGDDDLCVMESTRTIPCLQLKS